MKIKSLAEEARIIRKEERKFKGPIWGQSETRNSLTNHRRYDVRNEARASLIAYGFLRGKKLSEIEKSKYKDGLGAMALRRACKIAEKFNRHAGVPAEVTRERFYTWVAAVVGSYCWNVGAIPTPRTKQGN